MGSIEQNICDAIEVITNNIVSKAGFDRTIQATIVACVNESIGKYKVKYQDNTIYAYSADIEKKYSKGNRVYVLIPGNDMSRDKTILGIIGQTEEYVSTEMGETFEKTSSNFIIRQDNQYQIYSGTEYNKELNTPSERYGKSLCDIDDVGFAYTLYLENEEIIADCMENSNYFYVNASFKTNLPPDTIVGKYGLKIFLECSKENGGTYTDILTFDFEHGITGQFYYFSDFEYKSFTFPKPSGFLRIQKIELFAKDFITQLDSNKIYENDEHISEYYDISVCNIGIYSANSIKETVGDAGIEIYSPMGRVLKDNNTELPIKAKVFEHGKVMEDNANQFYWFKRDLSVNSVQDPKYCNVGGFGWSCLNNTNSGNWIPGTCNFNFFESEHLTAHKNQFKVISRREAGNSIIQYEKTFDLYNNNKNFYIKITSNKDKNTLSRTVQDLRLNCNVLIKKPEGTLENESQKNYKYYWSVNTNVQSWNNKENIYNAFHCIFQNENIKNEDNVIESIQLNRLSSNENYITFSCTVKEKNNGTEILLNTASYTIILAESSLELYTLDLVNGTQIFQYDEYGDAPTKNGNFIPKDLSVKLTDNISGEEIDLDSEIKAGKASITWILPGENDIPPATMLGNFLRSDGIEINETVLSYKSLKYTLLSPFNNNNIDTNVIKVRVTLGDKVFEKSTNFTFLTQGDAGTNGTSYSAIIVPNVGANEDIPKWAVFYKTGNYSGEFNFGPIKNVKYKIDNTGSFYQTSEVINTGFPFKIQLSGGGELIFNDYKDGVDTHGNNVKINWEMQILKYDNSHWDKSNFILEKINNGTNWNLKYNSVLYNNNDKIVNSDKELVPANILKCSITYTDTNKDKEFVIYATLPIVTIINNSNNFTLDLDTKYGYSEVVYNRDGCMPRYDNINKNFVIKYSSINQSYSSGRGTWSIKGHSGIEKEGTQYYKYDLANNLKIVEINNTNKSAIVEPIYKFNGSSATNAIVFTYKINDNSFSYIHIPIDMHLNRFGLAMLNDWDGTSIDINDNGGYILAPQIGAGYKEKINKNGAEINVFTGMVMGQAKEASQRDMHPGLYGFYKGEKTIGIHADSGIASFGLAGKSQIIIDPSTNGGYIYGGNFFKSEAIDEKTGFPQARYLDNLSNIIQNRDNYNSIINRSGMIIDLTHGHIYYGSDKFHLDQNGNLTCLEGHFSNGKLPYTNRTNEKAETYFMDFGNDAQNPFFLYCRSNYQSRKENFSVSKQGEVTANLGKIGGFYIRETFISSETDITKGIARQEIIDSSTGGSRIIEESVVTLSISPFSRKNMYAAVPFKLKQDVVITDSALSDANNYSTVTSPWDRIDLENFAENDDYYNFNYTSNNLLTNLLMAIGNTFAVTKEGIIYGKALFADQIMSIDSFYRNSYISNQLTARKIDTHSLNTEEITTKTLTAEEITTDNLTGTGILTGFQRILGGDTEVSLGKESSIYINEEGTIYFNGNVDEINIGDLKLRSGQITCSSGSDEILTGSTGNYIEVNCNFIRRNSNPNKDFGVPWMTFSNVDEIESGSITSLPTGFIYLVYED